MTDWLCPICSMRTFPYGQGCPLWEKDQCPDAAHAHLTGQWYNKNRELKEAETIGIGAIADERTDQQKRD